jgi:hypothetical protein
MEMYDITNTIEDENVLVNINSVFSNDLENNMKVFSHPNYETIHVAELRRNVIDDEKIKYQYNMLGYRSDPFIKKTKTPRIVFSGCSETEGVGHNLENVWSKIVYNYLSKDKEFDGFFNLGLNGSGFARIISNLLNYIKTYGSPDYIFILFPNIGRWTEWVDDIQKYQNIGVNPWIGEPKDKDDTDIKLQRDLLIEFILLIKQLEYTCELNNTKLYWSTWDPADEKNYQILINKKIIKNFINIKFESILQKIQSPDNYNKDETYFWARDKHMGTGFHELFADAFIDNLTRNDNANI